MKTEAQDFDKYYHNTTQLVSYPAVQDWFIDSDKTINPNKLLKSVSAMSKEQKSKLLYMLITSVMDSKDQENADTAVDMCNGDCAKILKGMLNL